MRKFFFACSLALALSLSFGPTVFAQTTTPSTTTKSIAPTVLPSPGQDSGCEGLAARDTGLESKYYKDGKAICLGEKIITGKIHFSDLPFYIGHIIKFCLLISGALGVFFIVFGGFQYILSGVNVTKKENGKSSITYAIIGLVVIILSWYAVDVVINLVTS